MNDEEAFQAALDTDPEDHVTRLVFADWLQERGDARAEGYRALGRFRKRPCTDSRAGWILGTDANNYFNALPQEIPALLPNDWFLLVIRLDLLPHNITEWGLWFGAKTRREVEDAAALAFTRLPAERRAELLAGKPEAGE